MSDRERRSGCRISTFTGGLVIALVGGAVLTVLVAWAAALWSPLSQPPGGQLVTSFRMEGIQGPRSQDVMRSGIGLTSRQHTWFVEAVDMDPGDKPRMRVAAGDNENPHARLWGVFQMNTFEAGWPLRCLRATDLKDEVMRGPDGELLPPAGWLTAGVKDAETHLPVGLQLHAGRTLPLEPIWSGLLINTIILGGAPYVLLIGSVAVRQRRRLRRGQCLDCGYPLEGAERCPECGVLAPDRSAFSREASV